MKKYLKTSSTAGVIGDLRVNEFICPTILLGTCSFPVKWFLSLLCMHIVSKQHLNLFFL